MSTHTFEIYDGTVTDPAGYTAAGVACGIKDAKPDLALLMSEVPAAVAGVFTSNAVCAPSVVIDRERLQGGLARAIVVNSGNANACTGPDGHTNALAMCAHAATRLDVPEEQVFGCSTGVIGVPLPMDAVSRGIDAAAGALSPEGGAAAAQAILTTDVSSKECGARLEVDGKTITIGGMAKGAGMIEPNMATMLAFLTTDAQIASADLQACLKHAADMSFNRITVDGCQSTNDTVLLLANGVSRVALGPEHVAWPAFCEAVQALCLQMALAMVADGEGATKVVTVNVSGAADDADAGKIARAVSNSILVKTAWYGGDPNWGRIVDAIGFSGAKLQPDRMDIIFDDVPAFLNGAPVSGRLLELEKVLAQHRFSVNINVYVDDGRYHVYASDCTEEYVRFNSAYTS